MEYQSLFFQETVCMEYQSLFSGKNKNTFINSLSAEFAQSVVKVNNFWNFIQ